MESLTLTVTLLVVAALPLGWLTCYAARHTSLVPAARWETLTLVAIGVAELAICAAGNQQAAWVAPLRWAAASTGFCGWMARLGARRPHQEGWQFVVASLWVVLALPAAEVFLLQRGQTFEVHAARGWFLWLLVGGGLLNTLPTNAWAYGLLTAAGQVLLLFDNLPALRSRIDFGNESRGVVAAALALLAIGQFWRALTGLTSRPLPGLTGVWLDFRDQFGSWWALRLLDRINATATTEGWPTRLTWNGFQREKPTTDVTAAPAGARLPSPEDLPRDQLDTLRQTTWNQLRRFVSPDWVGGRLGDIPRDD